MSISKKNITFITLIFPELLIPKNVVVWMPESCCFRTTFEGKRVKGSETLLKSARQHFYANVSFISDKVKCVLCVLVGSKMWGANFNTLTAHDMYFSYNREKFPQQVPTQLSSKPKSLYQSFIGFLESAYNFTHFF